MREETLVGSVFRACPKMQAVRIHALGPQIHPSGCHSLRENYAL